MTAKPSARLCATPWKIGHCDKAAALIHLRQLRRSGKTVRGRDLHVYRCDCGTWHVGHDPRALDRRIRRALRKKEAS